MTKKQDDISKGLDQAIIRQENSRTGAWLATLKKIGIAFPILLLIIAIVTSPVDNKDSLEDVIFNLSPNTSDSYQSDDQSYLSEIKGIDEEAEKFSWPWTDKNYTEFTIPKEPSKRLSLRQVTKKYGRASYYDEHTDSNGNVYVDANYSSDDDDSRTATLSFKKYGDKFRLVTVRFDNLLNTIYPTAIRAAELYQWNQGELDKVELSQSPKEIYEKYGKPTAVYADASLYAGEDDFYRTIEFYYQEDNDETSTINSVSLMFQEDDDGKLVLIQKDGVFKD